MVTTPRATPGGIMLLDGFSTVYAFAADSDVSLWEKSDVKIPGISGGEAKEITNMHNNAWMTKAPGVLKELLEGGFQCGYSSGVITQIIALINVNGWITAHLPDGSTLDFPGYLQMFDPAGMNINNQPLANVKIIPTMQINGVETAAVYTPA